MSNRKAPSQHTEGTPRTSERHPDSTRTEIAKARTIAYRAARAAKRPTTAPLSVIFPSMGAGE